MVASFDEAGAGQQAEAAQDRIEVDARLGRKGRRAGRAAGGKRIQDPGTVEVELIA